MDAMLIGVGGLAAGVGALSLAAQGASWVMYAVAAGVLAGARLARSAAELVAGPSPELSRRRRSPAVARAPAPR